MRRRGFFSLLLAPLLARFAPARRDLLEADLRRAADAIWAREPKELYFLSPDTFYAEVDGRLMPLRRNMRIDWYDPQPDYTVSMPKANGVIKNLTDDMCGD